MWVKTVNRQFRMMNSVLFRKVDYRTVWSFNPETRSQPQTSPFQWGLLEEVPHLSVTVCETQRAFLSRLLFKFFFLFWHSLFQLWERLCLIPDGALRPDALWAHGYALPHALSLPPPPTLAPSSNTPRQVRAGWSDPPKTQTSHEPHHTYCLCFDRCMFLTFSQTTTQEKYLETQFNFHAFHVWKLL